MVKVVNKVVNNVDIIVIILINRILSVYNLIITC